MDELSDKIVNVNIIKKFKVCDSREALRWGLTSVELPSLIVQIGNYKNDIYKLAYI